MVHHFPKMTTPLKTLIRIGLSGYFLLFTAGIPMVTFLCGSGQQRTVCMMDDCEPSIPENLDPTISSPDCCIQLVTRSVVRSAIVHDSSPTYFTVTPSTTEASPTVLDVPSCRADALPPLLDQHTPLFVQHRSLLI